MKVRALSVVLLCALLVSLYPMTAQAGRGNEQDIEIKFSAPMSPDRFIELGERLSVRPKELYFEEDGVQGGYTPRSGESTEEALAQLVKHHEEFLRNALASTEEAVKGVTDPADRARLEKLRTQFEAAQRDFEGGRFALSGIRLAKDADSISLMEEEGLVQSVTPVRASRARKSEAGKSLGSADEKSSSLSHEYWAPYSGTSRVSSTFTFQTFYFNRSFSIFTDPTYEQETQIYNSSYANYAGYWSSNLPRAYYDTPFLDTMDNFTVGSADAKAIQTYTQYWTYMSLTRQSATSATLKVRGQLGVRYPSWCYWTWCVYAAQTTYPGQLTQYTLPNSNTVYWSY
jgi:hypothetical protein